MLLIDFLVSFGNFTLGVVCLFLFMVITNLVGWTDRKKVPWLFRTIEQAAVYCMILCVGTIVIIYVYKTIAL